MPRLVILLNSNTGHIERLYSDVPDLDVRVVDFDADASDPVVISRQPADDVRPLTVASPTLAAALAAQDALIATVPGTSEASTAEATLDAALAALAPELCDADLD